MLLSTEAGRDCILQRTLSNTTESVLLNFLPDASEHGLEVCGPDPQRDGGPYLVVSARLNWDASSPIPAPSLPPEFEVLKCISACNR
ncbi:unnamed protein product [Schistocephalus solidus]|uniref:Integrin_alpha2 domain-containing protein n=1 Tax=Schistocephalus solidus TaxID=70667 RepID=A0A183SSI6_SCHSO|nr:unnamed protein product [Schistocephalus solidus]